MSQARAPESAGATPQERESALLEVMREAGSAGARAGVAALEQMEGGWSRHSWIAEIEDPDADGPRRYIVRIKPHASVLETSLEQEFRIYEALGPEPLPTPSVHGFQPGDSPFGGPFFVMEMLPGASVNVWRRRDRDALEADWNGPRGIAEDFVRHMAATHNLPADRFRPFTAERSFRDVVGHWRAIWDDVRLLRDPVVEEAYAWVLDREPDAVPPGLVHSDFRIGNCLMDGGRISGLLDWELAYVGDPRFDLGYLSLPYSSGALTGPGSPLLGAVAEREWLLARYEELTGGPVDREAVRTFAALSALMLFSILSTGVRVFEEGRSTDVKMVWGRFILPALRLDLARLMGWREGDWQ